MFAHLSKNQKLLNETELGKYWSCNCGLFLRCSDQQSIQKARQGSSTKVRTAGVKTMVEDIWNQSGQFIGLFVNTLVIILCWMLILIQDALVCHWFWQKCLIICLTSTNLMPKIVLSVQKNYEPKINLFVPTLVITNQSCPHPNSRENS